jgi:KUP system potassium uptake protein
MSSSASSSSKYNWLITLTALGVVYGDIGTSPLYALKEAFHFGHLEPNQANVFGLLSLVFWSLVIVISLKYVLFVLRADFNGEGGILALASILKHNKKISSIHRTRSVLLLLGVFGAAFLYGDGIITPAISILSAVEGIKIITPVFEPYVIPITISILVALFSIQKRGTAIVGKFFGPIILTWFVTMAIVGLNQIFQGAEVLKAINPVYAFEFFQINKWTGFVVLGSVFLVVTGGEALYSDLGHFGIAPIKKAWFWVVLPCLLLNYFGQGSYILRVPEAIQNPFYMMAPEWFLYPFVFIATAATTIASQALITGVFSITMQAFQQGYLHRIFIQHTSAEEHGQIYIKNINYLLMIGCILLVLTFKTSSNLAAAYGIAVTSTMIITTILFYFVAIYQWGWNVWLVTPLCLFFGIIDLAFLGSNLLKIFDGGWLPITLGFVIFVYMTTWSTGRKILYQVLGKKNRELNSFLNEVESCGHRIIPSIGIYMTKRSDITPYPLIKTYEHFKGVHKTLIFLHVKTILKPYVSSDNAIEYQDLGNGVSKITLNFGFMEKPDVPRALRKNIEKIPIEGILEASYFIGRENIFATEIPGMALWREKLFSIQSRNETPASEYFNLPRDRVLEIGSQIAI